MISVKLEGFDQLRRQFGQFERQLPFAAARALTETARKARAAVTASLPQVLDRPTPFTMNAFTVKEATKN